LLQSLHLQSIYHKTQLLHKERSQRSPEDESFDLPRSCREVADGAAATAGARGYAGKQYCVMQNTWQTTTSP